MLAAAQPYGRALENGLALKSVAGREDVERLADFNGGIHGDEVATLTRCLLLDHPHTRPQHWLYVEEEASGRIVSSLALIPWTWRYEDVMLRSGEMGIVGTLESYRHRGLVRVQVERFEELLQSEECDLSHIQGIPYFYRQFGYEYAIPLENWWRLGLDQVPDAPADGAEAFSFRPATEEDLPVLMDLYGAAGAELAMAAVRDEATWRYLLGPAQETGTGASTWLAMAGDGEPAGYFRVFHEGFGKGLIVGEISRLSGAAAVAVLRRCRAMAHERQKPYLRLNLPSTSALVQAARHLGAQDPGGYAWQIRLPDVGRLLRRLAPVWERRVAASPFAGLTRSFTLNLYREAFELRFQAGRLAGVEAVGFRDGGDLRLPPQLAAPLLLGYRDRADLARAHHDVSVERESGHLVDVLFPKVDSFLYQIY